jgi:hypothetical protein
MASQDGNLLGVECHEQIAIHSCPTVPRHGGAVLNKSKGTLSVAV